MPRERYLTQDTVPDLLLSLGWTGSSSNYRCLPLSGHYLVHSPSVYYRSQSWSTTSSFHLTVDCIGPRVPSDVSPRLETHLRNPTLPSHPSTLLSCFLCLPFLDPLPHRTVSPHARATSLHKETYEENPHTPPPLHQLLRMFRVPNIRCTFSDPKYKISVTGSLHYV